MRFKHFISGEKSNQRFILRDDKSGTEAEIFCFGALLNRFSVQCNDTMHNVIDGFNNVEEAKNEITDAFKSCKLNPFVCRMKHGKYEYDSKILTVRKFFLKQHAIHGLLYNADFSLKDCGANDENAFVTLNYRYEEEDEGFPFVYETEVTYKFKADNYLSLVTSVINHSNENIPLADGWHPYFKLDESIDSSTLQFNSDTMFEYDEELIPTGKKIKDEKFLKPILLKGVELDNGFELNGDNISPRCYLCGKILTLCIEPDANYPYLQVYTPPHRKSIAIENLSSARDSFNNKIGLILFEQVGQKTFSVAYKVSQTEVK